MMVAPSCEMCHRQDVVMIQAGASWPRFPRQLFPRSLPNRIHVKPYKVLSSESPLKNVVVGSPLLSSLLTRAVILFAGRRAIRCFDAICSHIEDCICWTFLARHGRIILHGYCFAGQLHMTRKCSTCYKARKQTAKQATELNNTRRD